MDVNHSAPVIASDQFDVNADPDTVWGVISGIDAWQSWNPAIKMASLDGPLAEGTTFRWKAGPGTITSTLRQVTPPWVCLDRQDDGDQGGPRVPAGAARWQHRCAYGQVLGGAGRAVMRRSLQRQLENALRPGLQRLTEESERRASTN